MKSRSSKQEPRVGVAGEPKPKSREGVRVPSGKRHKVSPFEIEGGDKGRGVFLYEFARESVVIRSLVMRAREESKPVSGWPVGVVLLPQRIRIELKRKPDLARLVEALASCPLFPDEPAENLKDANWLKGLSGGGALRPLPWVPPGVAGEQPSPRRSDTIGSPLAKLGQILDTLNQVPNVAKFETAFSFAVDWRQPDAVIARELRQHVLRNRPRRFATLARIRPEQVPLMARIRKVPFTLTHGLEWLRTLRRFNEAGGNWHSYFERWAKNSRQDYDSWRRQRQNEKEKALRIVTWLEQGAHRKLTRKDFR